MIPNQGDNFNPEKHQPVASCEPSCKIVYTTYPGYCVDNRIIDEALRAFVFTEPDKPSEDKEKQTSEINQTQELPNSPKNQPTSLADKEVESSSNNNSSIPKSSETNKTQEESNYTENEQHSPTNEQLDSSSNNPSPISHPT